MKRTQFDDQWKFLLDDSHYVTSNYGVNGAQSATGYASDRYDDRGWREVNLPHDWAVELPFHLHTSADHGHKPVPLLNNGIDARQIGIPMFPVGWYRKTFDLPEALPGVRTWVVFDGIFRDAIVWLNSQYLDRHASGYLPLRIDISDLLRAGEPNVLALRVDASQKEGWWYEGAGIYRHVWLEQAGPLHVTPDSLYANAAPIENGARLALSAEIANAQPDGIRLRAEARVLDAAGAVVAQAAQNYELAGWGSRQVEIPLEWQAAVLWSLEQPYLYRVELRLVVNDEAADGCSASFGVRSIRFDPDQGFFLNGQPVKLQGACNHQDFAGVGVALPDRLHEYKIQRLKEIGCNAYRCAHHAHAPEILEACDRLGMLVMDETRTLGSSPEQMRQLNSLIRRDRNHPSIILWSLGNEENAVQNTATGRRTAQTMIRSIRALDRTRPITYAGNNGEGWSGVNEVVDVRGWNYFTTFWESSMDRYHADHPHQPMLGSEEVSALLTRDSAVTDRDRQVIRDVDESATVWGSSAEGWWRYTMARPYLAGGFAWTGFDYRGEPGPFLRGNLSNFGLLDLCGFLKSSGRYLHAWWTNQPVLHLMPHWNHAGQEGQPVEVVVYSNCDAVELFLNERSQGLKEMARLSNLRWMVNYAPGVLEAVGYQSGVEVMRTKRETAGNPAGIRLHADRSPLRADGQDVAVITVALVDAAGVCVPADDRDIAFVLEGPGRILGVGNGDPNSSEPEQYLPFWEQRSLTGWITALAGSPDVPSEQLLFQAFAMEGPLPPVWSSEQNSWLPVPDERTPNKIPGPQELIWLMEPVHTGSVVIARASFALSAAALGAGWNRLAFGRVFSRSQVWINGQQAAELPEQPGMQVVDSASFLTAGTNWIEVRSPVERGVGGTAGGAWLCRQVTPPWQRRTFHGLAQILVQSAAEPGQAMLRAQGVGLVESELPIIWVSPTVP